MFAVVVWGYTAFCAKWFALTGSSDRQQQSGSFYCYCSGTKHIRIMTQSNLKLHMRCFFFMWTLLNRQLLYEENDTINFKARVQHFGKLADFLNPNSNMRRWTRFNYQCPLFYYPGFRYTFQREKSEEAIELKRFHDPFRVLLARTNRYQHGPLNIQRIIKLKACKPTFRRHSGTHFTPKICYHTSLIFFYVNAVGMWC